MSAHLPERLRDAVATDHGAVRPLLPACVRALDVALWAVVILVAVPALVGMRHDAPELGWLVTWGAAVLECTAGVLLVAVALREAIPGSGASGGARVAALVAGFVVQGGVAALTWMRGSGGLLGAAAEHGGATCTATEGMLALPALAIAALLIVRGLPVRPPWAGALAGLASALVADGVWHLACPSTNLFHLLVWHGGATAGMTLAGWLLGVLWQNRKRR